MRSKHSPTAEAGTTNKPGLGEFNHLRSWVNANMQQSKGWDRRIEGRRQAHHKGCTRGGCVYGKKMPAEWWDTGLSFCGPRVKRAQNPEHLDFSFREMSVISVPCRDSE